MAEQVALPDCYFHKVVTLRYAGQELRFRVAQDLFSSYGVDVGTQRLLRTLLRVEDGAFRRVLDLGCGYGPIGLALKKADPSRTVHLVDRDALAVAYARQNAALNGLAGVEVYGSLGYDDVAARDFDLVVCNVPAKAGWPVIAYLLLEARHYLRPGGEVAIVVVDALQPQVAELLGDPGIAVLQQASWPGHGVWRYRFRQPVPAEAAPRENGLQRGVYHRAESVVAYGRLSFALQTAHNLSAADGLDQRSELLLKALLDMAGPVERALAFNPAQGHVPVALWTLLRPKQLRLVGRDLLSLRWGRENLLRNGCPGEQVELLHQAGLSVPGGAAADLIIGIVPEEEGRQATALLMAQLAEQAAPRGWVVLAAGSAAVTRLVDLARAGRQFHVRGRERRKGASLLLLERR